MPLLHGPEDEAPCLDADEAQPEEVGEGGHEEKHPRALSLMAAQAAVATALVLRDL